MDGKTTLKQSPFVNELLARQRKEAIDTDDFPW